MSTETTETVETEVVPGKKTTAKKETKVETVQTKNAFSRMISGFFGVITFIVGAIVGFITGLIKQVVTNYPWLAAGAAAVVIVTMFVGVQFESPAPTSATLDAHWWHKWSLNHDKNVVVSGEKWNLFGSKPALVRYGDHNETYQYNTAQNVWHRSH